MAGPAGKRDEDAPAGRRARTLEARFTLFVVALLLAFGVFSAVVSLNTTTHQAAEALRTEARHAGIDCAADLVEPIERRRRQDVEAVLRSCVRHDGILAANARDAGGVMIDSYAAPRGDAASGATDAIEVPIHTRTGAEIGTLSITVASGHAGAVASRGLVAALVAMALFVAFSIPLTVAMVRLATAPLRKLTAFAEQLTAQKLATRIDIRSGDEFETLANAFNEMVARVNAAMRRVQHIAFVDATTDLPNGDRLMRDLAGAIEDARRVGAPGALFLISAERAANSIASLGQEAARDLVIAIAQRLSDAVKLLDPCGGGDGPVPILARLGNAEFAVLYPRLLKGVDVHSLARALVGEFVQPFTWREHRIAMPAHVGAAFFPRDGEDVDTLVRHARLALSGAGEEASHYKLYTRGLDRAASAKLNLEREMRAALERNEFRAYFQPKINLRNGRIEGAEALARWVRSDGGVISPAKFIPAAESMGLIGPISEAVMRDACWKAAGWSRDGLAARVSVNVSALQFADDNLPAKVMRILEQAGLPAPCLELEITESVAMGDVDRALRIVDPLRAAGVRFALDDFGTGHSSLGALTRLPFGVLKIDQTFIRGLSIDGHAAVIVEAILAMAAALNYEVVAEGVETEEEAEFLRRRGCLVAQGYLYSAAQPPSEYLRMLRQGAIPPRRGTSPPGALDPAA